MLSMSKKFIEVKLITNATRLTEDLCHHMLKSEVDILNYSVDADEKELYERIRLKENLSKFMKISADL